MKQTEYTIAFQVVSQLCKFFLMLRKADSANTISAFVITDAILLQQQPAFVCIMSSYYMQNPTDTAIYLLILVLAWQIQKSYHISYENLQMYVRSTVNQLFGHLVVFYMSKFFLSLDQVQLFSDYILVNCFTFLQLDNYCVETKLMLAVFIGGFMLVSASAYVDLSCMLHVTLMFEGLIFQYDVNRGGQTYYYCHLLLGLMYKLKTLLLNDGEYNCKVLVVGVVSHLMFILLQYQNQIQRQLQTLLHLGSNNSVQEIMLQKLSEIRSIYSSLLDKRAMILQKSMIQLLQELENLYQLSKIRIIYLFIDLCRNSIPDCEHVVYLSELLFGTASSSQATSQVTVYSKVKTTEEQLAQKYQFLQEEQFYDTTLPSNVVALVPHATPALDGISTKWLPPSLSTYAVLLYTSDCQIVSAVCVFVKNPLSAEFVSTLYKCFYLANRTIEQLINSAKKQDEKNAQKMYQTQCLVRAELIMLRRKVGIQKSYLAEAILCQNEAKPQYTRLSALIKELEFVSIEWTGFCCQCLVDLCLLDMYRLKAIIQVLSEFFSPVQVEINVQSFVHFAFPQLVLLETALPQVQLLATFYREELKCGPVRQWEFTTIPELQQWQAVSAAYVLVWSRESANWRYKQLESSSRPPLLHELLESTQ